MQVAGWLGTVDMYSLFHGQVHIFKRCHYENDTEKHLDKLFHKFRNWLFKRWFPTPKGTKYRKCAKPGYSDCLHPHKKNTKARWKVLSLNKWFQSQKVCMTKLKSVGINYVYNIWWKKRSYLRYVYQMCIS